MQKAITIASAIACTAISIAIAATGAADRAHGITSHVLLAALSIAIVIIVHLAPALLKSLPAMAMWAFWSICLLAALYTHASFFSKASFDAAVARAASSPAAAARAAQRKAIEHDLDQIKARPISQIARQLSWTTDPSRATALEIELTQARRAEDLRRQLIDLAAADAAEIRDRRGDRVTQQIADLLGVSVDYVQLAVSITLAFLLEISGALLWREVFAHAPGPGACDQPQQPQQQIVHVNVNVHESDRASDLDRLRAAVGRGDCRPTIASIRSYLRCSQQKAIQMRTALLSQSR